MINHLYQPAKPAPKYYSSIPEWLSGGYFWNTFYFHEMRCGTHQMWYT